MTKKTRTAADILGTKLDLVGERGQPLTEALDVSRLTEVASRAVDDRLGGRISTQKRSGGTRYASTTDYDALGLGEESTAA